MRILLRKFADKEYVWKEATYDKGNYLVDNECVPHTNIVTVDGLYKNHVMCSCGAIIENDNGKILAHYAEREAQLDCSKCKYLVFPREKEVSERKIIKQDGDVWQVTEEFTAKPYCNAIEYRYSEIDAEHIRTMCAYKKCRRNGVNPLPDIFHQQPGIFDTAITSDMLIKKKYNCDGYNSRYGYFMYDMKSRGTIKACVNSAGVVDKFWVTYRGRWLFYAYSEKYDKLYYFNGRDYVSGSPYWIANTKFEELHKKVKALFKEAN